MNSEDALEKSPTIGDQMRRTFWQRRVDSLFGYDFFISYAHVDGKTYAEQLALQLKQRGYECFIDTKESVKGDDWREIGYWALKRTAQLVLVGTQKALESAPVLREVEIFTACGKRVVPVAFADSLSPTKNPGNGILRLIKPTVLQIQESAEQLQIGPSKVAVEDLVASFQNRKQSAKRKISIQLSFATLLVLLGLTFYEYMRAEKQRKAADRQLAAISWLVAEAARDQELNPLKATHYFLSAAALNLEIGDKDEADNAILAAQLESAVIYRTFVHGEAITGTSMNPDESLAITWDNHGLAQLWNVSNGNPAAEPLKRAARITDCEFNSNGDRILTISSDGDENLWNGTNLTPIGVSITNGGPMGGADFNSTGKLLLTWGEDSTARLWNTEDGKPILKPMNLGQPIWHSTFDPDGNRILTWSQYGSLRMWNAKNGEPIGNQVQVNPLLEAALLTGKGDEVLTWTANGAVQLWNATNCSTSSLIWQGTQEARSLVAFGRNWILRNDFDGTTRLWRVESPPGYPRGPSHSYFSQTMLPTSPYRNLSNHVGPPSLDTAKIKLWSSDDSTPLGEMLRSQRNWEGVAFSPDESRLAVWDDGKEAVLWDTKTGNQVGQPMKHSSAVLGVTFSSESTRALTWSEDGIAKLFDTSTGAQVQYSMNHQQSVKGAFFLRNGRQIMTWSSDGTARIWNVEEQRLDSQQLKRVAAVYGAVFNRDGTRVLTWGADGAARLWNRMDLTPVGIPMQHAGEVRGALFSPDQRLILTFGGDGMARLWNAQDASAVGQPMKHGALVLGAKFSPDSTRIVTWSDDRKARLWRTENANPIGDFMHPVLEADFSANSKEVVTHGQDRQNINDQFAQIWSCEDGRPIGQHLTHPSVVVGAVFAPSGSKVLTRGLDSSARVWRMDGTPLGQPMVLRSPDFGSNWLSEIMGSTFSPDGRDVLIWNNLGVAQVFSLDSGEATTQVMVHKYVNKEGIVGGMFSHDGLQILTWGADGVAQLWDAKQGNAIGQQMTHATRIKSAMFDPSNRLVLTIGDDGLAKLWSAIDGSAACQPLKHGGAINGAIFTSNAKRILTWSDDGKARLWDAANGQCIGSFAHQGPVLSACFSPNEECVLTASRDGSARIWDISVNKATTLKRRILEYEVRSATRLRPDGDIVVLKPKEWNEAKQSFANLK